MHAAAAPPVLIFLKFTLQIPHLPHADHRRHLTHAAEQISIEYLPERSKSTKVALRRFGSAFSDQAPAYCGKAPSDARVRSIWISEPWKPGHAN